MERRFTLLILAGAEWALGPQSAHAQRCYASFHSTFVHRGHTSGADALRAQPLDGVFGLLGLANRAGTPLRLDLDADYWVLPHWSTGLRSTDTNLMPASPSADA